MRGSCTDLAKRLAANLYEAVKLTVEATWDAKTFELQGFEIIALDDSWQDVHLAQVLQDHGGILPAELSVASTEELMARRTEERGDPQ